MASRLSISRPRRSVAPLFDRIARFYDADFIQRLGYKPPQDEVVVELRQAGSRRIADVGCGTGILASRLKAELGAEVVYGIDASDGMLDQAKARSSEVEWRHALAEQLPLPDGAVDAVVSTTAFHFFDRPKALAEFYRVLGPGGRAVVVTSLAPTRLISQLSRLGNIQQAPTRHEMRESFERAGFSSVKQRRVRRPFNLPTPEVVTIGVRPA